MVIPFGYKKTDVTYKETEKDSFIVTQVTEQLYNINLVYYNEKEKIAILTIFKSAPSTQIIENFLNEYLATEDVKIKIRPILRHTKLQYF